MRTSMLVAFSTTTIGWLLVFSSPATGSTWRRRRVTPRRGRQAARRGDVRQVSRAEPDHQLLGQHQAGLARSHRHDGRAAQGSGRHDHHVSRRRISPRSRRPAAVVVPGPVKATIKEWLVPTLGSRPRDPLAARDGSFWWAAMYGHRLGRLDLEDGRHEGVSAARWSWSARTRRRQGRQRLVHRHDAQRRRHARSEDRDGRRAPDAGGRPRTAHAGDRSEGHRVVHDPVGRGRPHQSADRRAEGDEAAELADAIRTASRSTRRGSRGTSISAAIASRASIPTRWRSRNTRCRRRSRGRAASRSRRTM